MEDLVTIEERRLYRSLSLYRKAPRFYVKSNSLYLYAQANFSNHNNPSSIPAKGTWLKGLYRRSTRDRRCDLRAICPGRTSTYTLYVRGDNNTYTKRVTPQNYFFYRLRRSTPHNCNSPSIPFSHFSIPTTFR